MRRETRLRLEAHWARRLGCASAMFGKPGIHLAPPLHPGAAYLVEVGRSIVACAAPRWHEGLRAAMRPTQSVERASLARVFPKEAIFVGPAFIGYAETMAAETMAAATMDPPESAAAPLARAERAQLDALRSAASEEEWLHAGLDGHDEPVFVVRCEGGVAAAAGYERLLREVAHIGVLCAPRHRGIGLGRRVVAAAASHALTAGLLAQYQTLWSNTAAIAVARALGFEHFATTMAVRLPAEDGTGVRSEAERGEVRA